VICRFDVFEKATFKKQFSFLISKIKDTTIIISFSQVVSRSSHFHQCQADNNETQMISSQKLGFKIQDILSKSHSTEKSANQREELN
jgi:hypothetical protein